VAQSDQVDAVLSLTWSGEGAQADAMVSLALIQYKPIVPVVTIDAPMLVAQGLPAYTDFTRACESKVLDNRIGFTS